MTTGHQLFFSDVVYTPGDSEYSDSCLTAIAPREKSACLCIDSRVTLNIMSSFLIPEREYLLTTSRGQPLIQE